MTKNMTLGEYLEIKYEQEIGEPWSALEESVRERNKDFFLYYDDERLEVRKWWQVWKSW